MILNKVRGEADAANAEDGVADFARRLTEHSPLLRDDFRLIGCIPGRTNSTPRAPATSPTCSALG